MSQPNSPGTPAGQSETPDGETLDDKLSKNPTPEKIRTIYPDPGYDDRERAVTNRIHDKIVQAATKPRSP